MDKIFGKTKHIHFIGIGGIGMSGMAELLFNHGFIISGSDIFESERVIHLKKIGMKCIRLTAINPKVFKNFCLANNTRLQIL